MTILKFEGTVDVGDEYRCMEDDEGRTAEPGAILVGDRDLVGEVEATKWSGPVTFAFGDQRWTGDVAAEIGWGYSEYTPMDADKLFVGPHDIIMILSGTSVST